MSTGSIDKNACQTYQHLIAWYPTSSLSDDERRQVDEHTAKCTDCSKLLEFAWDMKTNLAATFFPHPAADALVLFVENREEMGSAACAVVESHLETCGECHAEIEMLEAVDQSEPAEDTAKSSSRRLSHHPADVVGQSRRWWDIFAGGMLRPAAAALYLAIAVVAVGLLFFRPERGGLSGAGVTEGVLDGVTILSDESGVVRGGDVRNIITTIRSGGQRFLLLELTGLDAPPEPGDVYTVRITGRSTNDTLLKKTVTGAAFSENFTLCLFLEHDSLEPGEYVVDVIAPDGNRVFRSSLTVE